MHVRHAKALVLAALMALSYATAASAVVLWDQSNWNTNGDGSVNLSSTSCSQISGNTKAHTACDVHFDNPVHITTIRIYETTGNVQTATQAYLWISPKTGSLPTTPSDQVNNAANIVPITSTTETIGGQTAVIVTAGGLSRDLPAGDYWVSLTPRHSLGIFPYSVHRITSGPVVNDPTPTIVACTVNSNWVYSLAPNKPDYAIKIEGDLPVPTIQSSWGRVKSIYR
jgi:hypothetical protein